MTSVETSGRSLDEAKHAALEALSAQESNVDFEILEDGTRNFLTLGSGLVRLRATLKKAGARPRKPRAGAATKDQPQKPASDAVEPVLGAAEAPEARVEPSDGVPAAEIEGLPPGPFCQQLLQDTLDGMEFDVYVELAVDHSDEVRLDLSGPDAEGLLLRQAACPPYANPLEAMQYLVSMIAHRACSGRPRIVLDAGNYRSKREESLRRVALQVADQVRQTGQEAVTDALNAAERRIIHTALVDDPDVTTYSEGVDPHRCVVISPRD